MSSIENSVQNLHTNVVGRLVGRISGKTGSGRTISLGRQLLLQALLLLIAFTVIFPIIWIVSLSLDPRGISRPTELRLIPPGASLGAYQKILDRPTSNPVTFAQLAFNSFRLAAGASLASVLIGVSAAYAFSRFKFPGREVLMLGVITVLMLPSIATIAPLFVTLNKVTLTIGAATFNLRNSLWGVGLAIVSGMLPFAIWNLKGYLDTIPKELEEAATIDGASPNQIFFKIVLPLSTPALAVTAFLGFMSGWTEFALSWQFLTNPKDFTLAMALWNMTGQYADNTPWGDFAAMSILIALPVSIVYLSLQRYIVGGLTIGGVKG
jgi:arabinogalactan oligomer/maltooligosaccharide transport system permease protein